MAGEGAEKPIELVDHDAAAQALAERAAAPDRMAWDGPEVVLSQCAYCRHAADYTVDGAAVCDAFLGGIPAAILRNEVDHRVSLEYDGGIHFEPRSDVTPGALARLDAELKALAGNAAG